MDPLLINQAEVEGFLFVFARVSVILLFAPVLGSGMILAPMRIGMVFMISIAVYPLVMHEQMPHPRGFLELAICLFDEALVGLTIAFAARLVFGTVQLAGTLVDFQMGFGMVNVIDPQTNSQVSVTSQVLNIVAVLMFFALDAHHLLIQGVVESFHSINPQTFQFTSHTLDYALQIFAGSFVAAIKMAAPVSAILFFLSVGLGLVARTVPQINIFVIGFPLQIAVGLLMLGLSMAFFTAVMRQQIFALPGQFMTIFRTF